MLFAIELQMSRKPLRGPMKMSAMSAATPPVRWTVPLPAKSMTPQPPNKRGPDVHAVNLPETHIMLIRAFHRNSEPMGDRSPLASGEITPSDPHRLTMQTLTTKLDNSSILRDAREAAEMAA